MVTADGSLRENRNLPLHPGINYSKTDVGGDLGGFVFALGSVVVTLVALPVLRPVYVASVGLGLVFAVVFHAWLQRARPSR